MSSSSTSRSYRVALVAMTVALIAPIPVGDWLDGVVMQLITPLSEPLTRLTTTVRTPETPFDSGNPGVARLQRELAQAETEIRRLEGLTANLSRQLEEYQQQSDERVRPLRARRVGAAAVGRNRSFRINAGSRAGVHSGVIATYAGYQLVGRVTEVDLLTSVVTPITEPRETGVLKVVVLYGETSMVTGATGSIEPTGEGTLSGLFDRNLPIAIGDEVRLADDVGWGEINIGLLVGVVTEIRPYDSSALHSEIVVRPEASIERVDAVMLRLPIIDEGGGG